jgi:hypothetical protein
MRTQRAFPIWCVLAGLAAATLALAAGFMFGILAVFTCHGTDTTEPPAPGSLAHTLCGWPGTVAFWSCLPVAVAAPIIGGIWSAVGRRGRPLALAFALAAAAMTALSVFFAVLFGGPAVALPAAAVFVVALAIERLVRRRERSPALLDQRREDDLGA